MAKEETAALITRHIDWVVLHQLAIDERDEAPVEKWLQADQRAWSRQQRVWKIEDELMQRATDGDDVALSHMERFLGVTA